MTEPTSTAPAAPEKQPNYYLKPHNSLSRIFTWTFCIIGAMSALRAAGGYTESGINPLFAIVDGVIGGLVWGGIVVGAVAIWRKVRSCP